MDSRYGNRTSLRRRRRCLLRGAENRRFVRGLRESREADRDGEEPEGVNEVPRPPARPLPSGEAEEGR